MTYSRPPEIPPAVHQRLLSRTVSSACVILLADESGAVLIMNNAREPQMWLAPNHPDAPALAALCARVSRAPLDLEIDL